MGKFVMIAVGALVVSTAFSKIAVANDGAKAKDLPECKTIVEQCEASNFKPGKHKKNKHGLWMDCVGKVAKGKTVSGVSVSAADAKICADAAKAIRQNKKAEHGY